MTNGPGIESIIDSRLADITATFAEYKRRTKAGEWAAYDAGSTHDFVACFESLWQHISEANDPELTPNAVLNALEMRCKSTPVPATHPWRADTLFRNRDFREQMLTRIEKALTRPLKFRAKVDIAFAQLFDTLQQTWDRVLPQGAQLLRGTAEAFFDPFAAFGVALYNAYAEDLLDQDLPREHYQQALNFDLKTRVCDQIYPYREKPVLTIQDALDAQSRGEQPGEWIVRMGEAWRLFEHPRHQALDAVVNGEFINLYGYMPELWGRLIDGVHKAISRRTSHWLAAHSRRAASRHRNAPDNSHNRQDPATPPLTGDTVRATEAEDVKTPGTEINLDNAQDASLQEAPTPRRNSPPILLLSEEELASHPEDPVGPNPCPVDHPAHKVWEDATREALLELFRFQEKKFATRSTTVGEYQNLFVEYSFMRFQIWAKRNLSIVRNDRDARAYDKWLHSYLEASMEVASKACRPDVPRQETLSALRVQLLRALKYWSGNALEDVSAFRKRQEERAVSPGGQSSEPKPYQSLSRQEPTGTEQEPLQDDTEHGLPSSDPGSGPKGDVSLLIGARAITPINSPRPPGPLAQLSQRDLLIHDIVGRDRFAALTNADIMQDRNLKKRLRNEFKLTTADAAKASLDRIRKVKGYLLSGEIKKKRSGQ